MFWFIFSSEKENKLIELEKPKHHNSFIAHVEHGFDLILNTLITFRGVRMGEGSRPQLRSVTTLTGNTGNRSAPTVSSGKIFGGSRCS